MSHKRELRPISPAVVEMLRHSGELDRILRGLVFDNPPPPARMFGVAG